MNYLLKIKTTVTKANDEKSSFLFRVTFFCNVTEHRIPFCAIHNQIGCELMLLYEIFLTKNSRISV